MRKILIVIPYKKLYLAITFLVFTTVACGLIIILKFNIPEYVNTFSKLDEEEIAVLEKENSKLTQIIEHIVPNNFQIIQEDSYRNIFINAKNFTPPTVSEQSLKTILEKGKKTSFKVLYNNPSYLRPLYTPDWKSTFYRGWLYLPHKNIQARHRLFIYPFGGSSIYDFIGELAFYNGAPIDYHRNINFLIYDFQVTDIIRLNHQVLITGKPSMTGVQIISIVQDDLLEKDESTENFLFHLTTPKGYELDYIYGNVIKYEYLLKTIEENTVKTINSDIETLDKLLTENLNLKKKLAYFVPTQDELITKNQGKSIPPTFPFDVPSIEIARTNGKEIPFTTHYKNANYKRPIYDPLWLKNYKKRWCYIPQQISLSLQRLFLIPSSPDEQHDFFGMLSFNECFTPLKEYDAGFLVYNFCVDRAVVYKNNIIMIGKPSRNGAQIISFSRSEIPQRDYIVYIVSPDDQAIDYAFLYKRMK
jgi:hypothetical protein